MARRRFSKIAQYPLLQTPYQNYKTWQDRTEPTSYPRQATSNTGGLVRLAVVPFGSDADQELIIKASRRANDNLKTALGVRVKTTLTDALRLPGFEPAKAIVFRGTGGVDPTQSKITKVNYKKRVGVSYTHGGSVLDVWIDG